MLLTLSPFAVHLLTPSYCHSQHPPRAPNPHLFSQLQAKGSYMPRRSRFPPVSPSCTLYSAVPSSSSTPLHTPTSSPSPDAHPHHVPEEQHLLLYVATTGLLAVITVSLHWVFTSSLFE